MPTLLRGEIYACMRRFFCSFFTSICHKSVPLFYLFQSPKIPLFYCGAIRVKVACRCYKQQNTKPYFNNKKTNISTTSTLLYSISNKSVGEMASACMARTYPGSSCPASKLAHAILNSKIYKKSFLSSQTILLVQLYNKDTKIQYHWLTYKRDNLQKYKYKTQNTRHKNICHE